MGAELQIFLDRELHEGAAPVRHMGDAAAGDVFGLLAVDPLALEMDRAFRAHHAGDRAQGRGLAGAIGAENGGNAARFEREIDAVQNAGIAVEGLQILRLHQGRVLSVSVIARSRDRRE